MDGPILDTNVNLQISARLGFEILFGLLLAVGITEVSLTTTISFNMVLLSTRTVIGTIVRIGKICTSIQRLENPLLIQDWAITSKLIARYRRPDCAYTLSRLDGALLFGAYIGLTQET